MNSYLCRTHDYQGDGLKLLLLFRDQPFVFLLDSSLHDNQRGRYSFIGFEPFEVFQSRLPQALDQLREKFSRYTSFPEILPTPFPAGIVGYLSYDYGLVQEKIRLKAHDEYRLPYCVFGFYDCILTVDHLLKKLYITSTGWPEISLVLRQKKARERLDFIERRLSTLNDSIPEQGMTARDKESAVIELKSNFTPSEYEAMVKRALDYIGQGDIYQVNLSQRFEFDTNGYSVDPLEIYRFLRGISPSHYGAYFDAADHQIISSSPEQFLHKTGRVVLTRPMKGTRMRGSHHDQDRSLREDILNSPKEKAELLMVTDLERNDLGKVCDYGSVKVTQMRDVEEYNTVFQTTSTVEGLLRKDKDAFDVLKACFPGGSVTGCPKIRAMEIIEELEPIRRGIYTGALGYMSFAGDMNFNVLIRTLLAHRNKMTFHVGGGIVADSHPGKEYEETLIKAKAMRACLQNVLQKKPLESNI